MRGLGRGRHTFVPIELNRIKLGDNVLEGPVRLIMHQHDDCDCDDADGDDGGDGGDGNDGNDGNDGDDGHPGKDG